MASTKTTAAEFFEDLANMTPFVKAGFQGFGGSGKTTSATELAIGLHQLVGLGERKITILDTEQSSRFLVPRFRTAGIGVQVRRTRKLADFTTTLSLLEEGDILFVDSLTHFWDTHVADYLQEKRRRNSKPHLKLQFNDWGPIKDQWRERFADPFVAARLHIIFTGRASYEYDHIENDDGDKEIAKSGVKMRAEGETAFEPDLVVHMERKEELLAKEKRVWREATLLKDRSKLLDGKTLKNPTFKDFEPTVRAILDNPAPAPVTEAQRSEGNELLKALAVSGAAVSDYVKSASPTGAKPRNRPEMEATLAVLRGRVAAQANAEAAAKPAPAASTPPVAAAEREPGGPVPVSAEERAEMRELARALHPGLPDADVDAWIAATAKQLGMSGGVVITHAQACVMIGALQRRAAEQQGASHAASQ